MGQEFIPYGRQDIDAQDIEAVIKVLKSDYLTQGPAVDAFEKTFGEYLGAKHVVAVANGTAALHLAYLAAGVGPGDAVIVPALTFAATANAALYCGATPVFADVDPQTLCLSAASAARAIQIAKDAGLKPKVLAPVHYAGRPADMPELVQLAEKHRLTIVEDACHAVGAEYRLSESAPWQKVGSASFAHMTAFSFHPVKHVTTGEGGAITTADPELVKRLKTLRTHGITKDAGEFANKNRAYENGTLNPWYMEMQMLGLNYRLCDIQATLGQSQVRRASAFVARRREVAKAYDEAFRGHRKLTPAPGDSTLAKHSYHLYPLRLDFARIGMSRAAFMAALREQGIGPQVHYIPVCWHPFYEANSKLWRADAIPEAIKLYETELSIPMYSRITDDMIGRVTDAILALAKP